MFNYHEKIRKVRENKNYTQEFMAESLHISQRAYSSIENGKTQLTIERLFDISKILEVSVSEILNLDNNNIYNNFNNQGLKNRGHLVNFKQNDLEEIKLLYERIIKIKDHEIAFLRSQTTHQ
ncbi:helix-turn-helix domain-containing protein [Capnocytophaga catalasegens]|uniref:HTH cro/C1-type domain-containing protein n=1 Tax=Capnocytophaga catalasegens TaxID=1004260 RepID=A0AAV5AY42_9FLAO|nr:helix-turn-helix transcriptional regulator [Capnocytophaga catalasegens]GIZ16311.1 hypothetical protein RCZ03_23110 [Capnocytophaga catalasegens]GJM50543.1 hypothetical protein RCZ15_15160 [Capnocytophaga catalasegens]GJM53222.1 hypothetical protein RCZ16_15390 [Capnocytophaga catalasegens]